MQSTLNIWSNRYLNWVERIALIKTMILPQFLFLFQMLPISISLQTLEKWQKMLINFVWFNKSHRISQFVLSRPSKMGFFGLPILQSYFEAAQLRAMFLYLHRSTHRGWVTMEESYYTPYF